MICSSYLSLFIQLPFDVSIKPTKLKWEKQRRRNAETQIWSWRWDGHVKPAFSQKDYKRGRGATHAERDREEGRRRRRKRIIHDGGGACGGRRNLAQTSWLFCLCQPLLIWSLQYQRARWDISLWYPPACPTGPIKSWKTQFASFTFSFFFHPTLLFYTSQDSIAQFFPLFPHCSLCDSLWISLCLPHPLAVSRVIGGGDVGLLLYMAYTVFGPYLYLITLGEVA